jgi:hypothetical protein
MHFSQSLWTGILALAIALTGPILAPGAASAASLKPLVVQSSEVASTYGSGFKTLSSRAMRASDLAGTATAGTSASFKALLKGFVGGYFSSFYRASRPAGVSVVTSGVSLYKDAVYPRTALELTMKDKASLLKTLRKEYVTTVRIDWFDGVGEKAIMMTYAATLPAFTKGGKVTKTQAVLFLFTRGKFASTLSISGYGTVSPQQALALAKRVDDRLRRAG